MLPAKRLTTRSGSLTARDNPNLDFFLPLVGTAIAAAEEVGTRLGITKDDRLFDTLAASTGDAHEIERNNLAHMHDPGVAYVRTGAVT